MLTFDWRLLKRRPCVCGHWCLCASKPRSQMKWLFSVTGNWWQIGGNAKPTNYTLPHPNEKSAKVQSSQNVGRLEVMDANAFYDNSVNFCACFGVLERLTHCQSWLTLGVSIHDNSHFIELTILMMLTLVLCQLGTIDAHPLTLTMCFHISKYQDKWWHSASKNNRIQRNSNCTANRSAQGTVCKIKDMIHDDLQIKGLCNQGIFLGIG